MIVFGDTSGCKNWAFRHYVFSTTLLLINLTQKKLTFSKHTHTLHKKKSVQPLNTNDKHNPTNPKTPNRHSTQKAHHQIDNFLANCGSHDSGRRAPFALGEACKWPPKGWNAKKVCLARVYITQFRRVAIKVGTVRKYPRDGWFGPFQFCGVCVCVFLPRLGRRGVKRLLLDGLSGKACVEFSVRAVTTFRVLGDCSDWFLNDIVVISCCGIFFLGESFYQSSFVWRWILISIWFIINMKAICTFFLVLQKKCGS